MTAGDSDWGNRPRDARIEVTDGDGWHKEFPLGKPLLYVGSDPRSDVVLDVQRGGGVAPRHLQLIAMAPMPGSSRAGAETALARVSYRAVNLSDRDVPLGDMGGRSLAPREAVEIVDGDVLRVGDFSLAFYMGASVAEGVRAPAGAVRVPAARLGQAATGRQEPAPVPTMRYAAAPERAISAVGGGAVELVAAEGRSAHIGLKLSLPRTRVEPEFPLEGAILVRNLGEEQGVQFRVEVKGLPPDSYQVGPGPILFPNVEKGVYLSLQHPRGPGLAAGRHEVELCASAPDAYPGEEVRVTHELEIVPYYHHTLALTVLD